MRLSSETKASLTLAIVLVATRAFAGQQTAALSNDTFINSLHPDNNNGAATSIFTGTDGQGGVMRGLVLFNMPSAPVLQGRVTVTDVKLTMVLQANGMATVGTAAVQSLAPLNQAWIQGSGIGNATGTFVIGTACTTGASWNRASCAAGSPVSWSTAGGSFGTAVGSVNTTGIGIGGSVVWDSAGSGNSGMNTDVQGWIDGTLTNNGWIIKSSTEGTSAQMQRFASSENGNGPSLVVTYSCKAAYAVLGQGCTTCTAAANSDCITTHSGNSCNDSGAPATTYSCTCDATVYKNGTGSDGNPACVIGCSPTNHCRDNGDTTATCADTSTGYTCTCDSGFISNGTSCVSACPGTPDPCGTGGSCTAVSGGWTCACGTGYVSSGGVHPACVNFNACGAAAIADCHQSPSFTGNACVDQPPPSVTYTCTCGNTAFVSGTGSDGGPGCVAKNYCSPNHCGDGGDATATCSNLMLGTPGYSCTCSSALWTPGLVAGNNSCIDTNECASGNPCVKGTCTNVAAGGGYTCACNTGYVSTGGTTPTCVQPNACDATANSACLTTKSGNVCVSQTAPLTGYKCTCGHAGYVVSGDAQHCVLQADCLVNHCIDQGDQSATCNAQTAPLTGYDCTCGPGWKFNGTTCADVNECTSGGNPCGAGFCNNTKGGYSCNCPSGYASSGGVTPTCVVSVSAGNIQVTSTPGSGCSMAAAHDPVKPGALLLLVGVWLLAGGWRRKRASARR